VSLPDTRTRYLDPEVSDPSLATAVEHVFEAGQSLISKRIDLLVEQLSAQSWHLFAASICAVLGLGLAFAGWLIAMSGLIDALSTQFVRFHVEIAVGLAHVALGVAIAVIGRSRLTGGSAS
jgi:hypothetical protein